LVVTGFKPLDMLVEPSMRWWGVEFYGDYSITSYILHHTLAFRSRFERIYLVMAQEFGGIRTDVLTKFCRVYECLLTNIYVVRVFSNSGLRTALSELIGLEDGLVVVAYPYNYLPRDHSKYFEASIISGLLRKVMQSKELIVFNTFTKFGTVMPEGGSMHHHVVKVIVMLRRCGGRVYATLVKHPAKPSGVTKSFHVKVLEDIVLMNYGRTLLEWVSNGLVRPAVHG